MNAHENIGLTIIAIIVFTLAGMWAGMAGTPMWAIFVIGVIVSLVGMLFCDVVFEQKEENDDRS